MTNNEPRPENLRLAFRRLRGLPFLVALEAARRDGRPVAYGPPTTEQPSGQSFYLAHLIASKHPRPPGGLHIVMSLCLTSEPPAAAPAKKASEPAALVEIPAAPSNAEMVQVGGETPYKWSATVSKLGFGGGDMTFKVTRPVMPGIPAADFLEGVLYGAVYRLKLWGHDLPVTVKLAAIITPNASPVVYEFECATSYRDANERAKLLSLLNNAAPTTIYLGAWE